MNFQNWLKIICVLCWLKNKQGLHACLFVQSVHGMRTIVFKIYFHIIIYKNEIFTLKGLGMELFERQNLHLSQCRRGDFCIKDNVANSLLTLTYFFELCISALIGIKH